MGLNLSALANNETVSAKMYSITIDGVSFGKLSESDTEKLIGIIKGMQGATQAPVVQQSVPQVVVVKKSNKSESKDFPDLGTPSSTVGNITAYKNLVRYWEVGFVPDKVKYGIKMALKEAGAT